MFSDMTPEMEMEAKKLAKKIVNAMTDEMPEIINRKEKAVMIAALHMTLCSLLAEITGTDVEEISRTIGMMVGVVLSSGR